MRLRGAARALWLRRFSRRARSPVCRPPRGAACQRGRAARRALQATSCARRGPAWRPTSVDARALYLYTLTQEEDFVCHCAGLPVEEPQEPADKLLAALAAAMDAHEPRGAGGKGVSSGGRVVGGALSAVRP